MKLPQLLSQFLYQKKRLDLPGIGTFTLDKDAVIPQESDKLGQMPATGIQFKNANIPTADDALVTFIKDHTGKMKSLAAADLDFYLTTGRQLLNIGKPFYLEGIGTLLKNRDGRLDFTPGEYMIARLEEPTPARQAAASYEEAPREREPRGDGGRQTMLLLLIVVGVAAIGWGGYYLYKRNNFSEPAEKKAVVLPDTASAPRQDVTTVKPPSPNDTTAAAKTAIKQDSAAAHAPATTPTVPASTPPPTANIPVADGATLYHFVILSTDNKHHALRRYEQLLGYQLNIKMDQKDSAWFKLYFPIAALPKDTAYIKDSLSDTYAAPHVTIEH